ncbi:hypothetical protein [Flavobacterium psychrotolerans]|uniref:DUF4157 domain-containing protein n=1 Tax=Flavobacterium psychrotolerans TaxID=2169410 RepID=A0A2U1JH04_9FLAO|nr:hypothetical protein [Flavobacterium psychrotolerans]PWA04440.1 hypothetical protein DB895_11005 [Flavobacterium psychrotolerans]
MILIVSKYLTPNGFRGITLFPFVVIRNHFDADNPVLINHEKIHLRQQLELLILPFFILYTLDYLIQLLRFKDKNKAYRNVFFEREAYSNERNRGYLKTRSFWAWRKYFIGNSH